MMPIGGMAAKMSSPATDVLSRWIRRFRKDKPPTVPEKVIDKALRHEEVRSGLERFDPKTGKPLKYGKPTIKEEGLDPSYGEGRGRRLFHLGPGDPYRPLGAIEKDDFKKLEDFMLMLRRLPDPDPTLAGMERSMGMSVDQIRDLYRAHGLYRGPR